jgi:hypothetical protein
MTTISTQDIKDAFQRIELWPDWREGRPWRVPIYPKEYKIFDLLKDDPCMPDPIPAVEFRVQPAIDNRTMQKVWLFYGYSDDMKVLVEVMKR